MSSLPPVHCLPVPVQAGCPQRIVFVLKEGEKWANSGGGDFVAHLKPPGVQGACWALGAGCCNLCFLISLALLASALVRETMTAVRCPHR